MSDSKDQRFSLGRLLAYTWWALGLLALLAFLRGPGVRFAAGASERGWTSPETLLDLSQGLVLIFLIFIAFFLGIRVFSAMLSADAAWTGTRPSTRAVSDAKGERGVGFPAPPTVAVGVWLGIIGLVLLVGLVESLAPMLFLTDRFPSLSCGVEGNACGDLHNLMVTMFAGGVGAMITTILGYLEHASEDKDFDAAYVPWYFARPLIGILLGAVFYFVLKGGLLATVGSQNAEDLDVYGLAAFGAMVGLFSKRAVEKLREVFGTLFQTNKDLKWKRKSEENQGTETAPEGGDGEEEGSDEGTETGEESGDG